MKVGRLLANNGDTTLKIHPNEPLPDASLHFSATPEGRKYSIAVVVDSDGLVVGVLSLGDIVHALGVLRDRAVTAQVADVMSKDVCCASVDQDLSEVLRLMAERHIRHMPVVQDGRCMGLVSRREAMEVLYNESVLQLKSVTEFVFRSGARY